MKCQVCQQETDNWTLCYGKPLCDACPVPVVSAWEDYYRERARGEVPKEDINTWYDKTGIL